LVAVVGLLGGLIAACTGTDLWTGGNHITAALMDLAGLGIASGGGLTTLGLHQHEADDSEAPESNMSFHQFYATSRK